MKKYYKIGDLVEHLFEEYGLGVIIEHKRYGIEVNAYCVHWADNISTWEAGRQVKLVVAVL